jgi:hypothetical protein
MHRVSKDAKAMAKAGLNKLPGAGMLMLKQAGANTKRNMDGMALGLRLLHYFPDVIGGKRSVGNH